MLAMDRQSPKEDRWETIVADPVTSYAECSWHVRTPSATQPRAPGGKEKALPETDARTSSMNLPKTPP